MVSMPTVPQSEASTGQVPFRQRLAFWDAHNCSELIGLRSRSFATHGLVARERNFDLGTVRLAEVAGNEHVIERTPALLRRFPKDSVFVAVVEEGEIFFYQRGRCLTAKAGDILIYPTSKPYLCGYAQVARQFLVDLPASSLLAKDHWPCPDGPIKIDGSLQGGQALGAELGRTLRSFAASPLARDAPQVADRMHILCQTLLTLQHDLNRTGALTAIRRLRAEAFIAEHLGDEDLKVAAVARHVCLSPRHLNRLFARDDCTVTHWIWQQRLALAHRFLGDPAQRHQSIAEIAHRCGFASAAHFTSAFKTRYDLTPTQHRDRAGRLDPSAPAALAAAGAGGRLLRSALRSCR